MKIAYLSAVALAAALALSSCGSDSAEPLTQPAPIEASETTSDAAAETTAGITLVSPDAAAATLAAAPSDLVVLDVRTPEEFAEGHIDGAVMIDFYRADFAAEIAKLDPDVPYVLYCRSGNRSGQTTAIMETLGFASVQDVDGGVLAWAAAGLPLVNE